MGVVANRIFQSKPAATTLTPLYEVPAGRRANVKLFIANQDAAVADLYRISIAPLGVADATSQYLVWDEPLALAGVAGCSDERSGIRLAATDILRVRSLNGDISFVALAYEEDT